MTEAEIRIFRVQDFIDQWLGDDPDLLLFWMKQLEIDSADPHPEVKLLKYISQILDGTKGHGLGNYHTPGQ